jgi:3-hydroxyacyl-CoA dehydrogenase
MVDKDKSILQKALRAIEESLSLVAKKRFGDDLKAQATFKMETLARIETSTDLASAVADVDLVIEAIVENVQLKQQLFAQIEAASKP